MNQFIYQKLIILYKKSGPRIQPIIRKSYKVINPILKKTYYKSSDYLQKMKVHFYGNTDVILKNIIRQNPTLSKNYLQLIERELKSENRRNFCPVVCKSLDKKLVDQSLVTYKIENSNIYNQEKNSLDRLLDDAASYPECFETFIFLCLHYKEILYYKIVDVLDSSPMSNSESDLSPFVYAMQ